MVRCRTAGSAGILQARATSDTPAGRQRSQWETGVELDAGLIETPNDTNDLDDYC